MNKYIIELSEEQMTLVANCLEDISRFGSGQCGLRYTIEEMVLPEHIQKISATDIRKTL